MTKAFLLHCDTFIIRMRNTFVLKLTELKSLRFVEMFCLFIPCEIKQTFTVSSRQQIFDVMNKSGSGQVN